MASVARLLGACVITLGLLASCASPEKPVVSPLQPAVKLHEGPVTDYVPSAGLRWLIVAKPKWLYQQPLVERSLLRLFPPKRLQAFADGSGIDLRRLDSGCIAGFDLGTLYLANAKGQIGTAQQSFVDRLVSEPLTRHPGTGITMTTGIIGLTPESFVALEGLGVALSVGDPTLAKIVAGFALGKFKRSVPALRGIALSQLPKELSEFPLVFYAPGPFSGKWATGAEGLLGQTTALAIAGRPTQTGQLEVKLVATGQYGGDVAATSQRVRQLLVNLSTSDLGRLLGFASESVTPEVVVDEQQVSIALSVPLTRLMDGLYTAVAADVWEMLELRGRPTPATPGKTELERRGSDEKFAGERP